MRSAVRRKFNLDHQLIDMMAWIKLLHGKVQAFPTVSTQEAGTIEAQLAVRGPTIPDTPVAVRPGMVASFEVVPAHTSPSTTETSRSARAFCPGKRVGSSSSSDRTTSVMFPGKAPPYVHQVEEVIIKENIVGNKKIAYL
jgi:hypothetical protein